MALLDVRDPLAVELTHLIQSGSVSALRLLLRDHSELVRARIVGIDGTQRSLLHIATDWPGHFPNVGAVIAELVTLGADVNTKFTGRHTESPLHWAASSDDLEAIDALLDAGADIEAVGAVIAGGTPMADATAFGQWRAAARLVERGARTNLFESATLGLLDRLKALEPFSIDDATRGLWGACHGGQLLSAQYLVTKGADVNWVSVWDGLTPLDAARRSEAQRTESDRQGTTAVVRWLESLGASSTGRS